MAGRQRQFVLNMNWVGTAFFITICWSGGLCLPLQATSDPQVDVVHSLLAKSPWNMALMHILGEHEAMESTNNDLDDISQHHEAFMSAAGWAGKSPEMRFPVVFVPPFSGYIPPDCVLARMPK